MHKALLIKALAIAEMRRGFCAPNPAVGAVIVKGDKIISEACHTAPGQAHAELAAIRQAGSSARGATLYVTLEPCSHTGRTPPCVDAIIEAGLKKVFFAYQDPNPVVCGNGQRLLHQAGIACEHMPIAEINDFYNSYYYWTVKRKPWVTLKLAVSLDGKIAFSDKPAVLTGSEANSLTHRLRYRTDAILTTLNTVLIDNPALNARCGDQPVAKNVYVLDRELQLPLDARLITTAKQLSLLCDEQASPQRKRRLQELGVRCIAIPCVQGHLSLSAALAQIGEDGMHDVWVEVGSQCFSALIKQQLAHELYLYITPKTLGKSALSAFPSCVCFKEYFTRSSWQALGEDVLCHFIVDK